MKSEIELQEWIDEFQILNNYKIATYNVKYKLDNEALEFKI